MPDEISNPETGEVDMESALAHLIQPVEAKEEEAEEAPQEAQPSEVESEEPEAATDEDDTDEEGVEAEEEAEAEPRMFTVKIDGKDVQVNEQELLSGYQRDADYRRKTQEVSDSRREIEAQKAEIAAMRAKYEEALQRAATDQEQEPDWVAMAQEDPIGTVEAKAKWDAKERARQNAQRELQAAQTQRHQQAVMECLRDLTSSLPGWTSEETRIADYKSMVETAKAFGFSESEVGNATDPRIHRMVHALMKERSKPAKPVPKKAPKVLAPGAKPAKADSREIDRALKEKFARSGSDEDGIAYLLGG